MVCDEVIPKFPHVFGRGEDVPVDLIGATILQMGTIGKKIESGEFVINYRAAGQNRVKRLVLLFNERGMWASANEPAAIQDGV
jgi:hypothetical protein